MKEHLVEVFNKIKDPRSPNNSYIYEESRETDLLGDWICLSIVFKKPNLGSGSIFKKKYMVKDPNHINEYRIVFMSELLSELLGND